MGTALFLQMLSLGSIIVGNAHRVLIITIATEIPMPLLFFYPILRRALFSRLFKLINLIKRLRDRFSLEFHYVSPEVPLSSRGMTKDKDTKLSPV